MVKVKAEIVSTSAVSLQCFNHPMVKVKGTPLMYSAAKCIGFNHPMVKVKVVLYINV